MEAATSAAIWSISAMTPARERPRMVARQAAADSLSSVIIDIGLIVQTDLGLIILSSSTFKFPVKLQTVKDGWKVHIIIALKNLAISDKNHH